MIVQVSPKQHILALVSFSCPSFIPYCISVLQVTYKLCSTHKQFLHYKRFQNTRNDGKIVIAQVSPKQHILALVSFSCPSFIPYCISVLQVTYKLCSTHKQFFDSDTQHELEFCLQKFYFCMYTIIDILGCKNNGKEIGYTQCPLSERISYCLAERYRRISEGYAFVK